MPPGKGSERPPVHGAALADIGRVEPGKRVVLIGGGPLGMECACTQSDMGRDVTVLEVMDNIPFSGDTGELLAIAEKNHVALRPGRTVQEITPDRVIVRVSATGETEEYPCKRCWYLPVCAPAGMRRSSTVICSRSAASMLSATQ
jgi:NADPH-dependent 2,4-dienoyl-CoA reductase/sulfur reductase-like enzyme